MRFPEVAIFLVGAILNFIWEYLHWPLYVCSVDRLQCAGISSVYDGLIVLGLYAGGLLLFRNRDWYHEWNAKTLSYLLLAGLAVAVLIEARALLTGRWAYTEAMPTLFGIGVSPVLQMISLPILTLTIVRRMKP